MATEPKKSYHSLTPDAILEIAESIGDPLAQAFFSFLYLTGARLNEATDFSRNRMRVHDDEGFVEIELKTLKTKDPAKRWRKIIIPIGKNAKCHENELWQFVVKWLGGFKNFDKPFRKWPSKWGMGAYLSRKVTLRVERRRRMKNGEYVDELIEKPLHPHFLRHTRATHLAEYYHTFPTILLKIFGWTDQNMTTKYTSSMEIKRALLGK